MARLSEDKINEIRSHSDIVEVVSKYIPLSKKGKNYVGVCPFHDDRDPSLTVSQDKQIFKCLYHFISIISKKCWYYSNWTEKEET